MFPLLDVTEKHLGFYLSGAQGWICSDGPGYSVFLDSHPQVGMKK